MMGNISISLVDHASNAGVSKALIKKGTMPINLLNINEEESPCNNDGFTPGRTFKNMKKKSSTSIMQMSGKSTGKKPFL